MLDGLVFSARATTRYRMECWTPGGGPCWVVEFSNLVTNAGLEYLLRRAIPGVTLPTIPGSSATGINGRAYPDGRRTPRVWTVATAVSPADIVQPTAPGANGRMFMAIIGGTTHASTQPTWPTTAGGTVVDNTVTWMEASLMYVGLKGSGGVAAGNTMLASSRAWTEIVSYSETTRRSLTLPVFTSPSVSNSASPTECTMNASGTVSGAFLVDFPDKGGDEGLLYGVGDIASPRSFINGSIVKVTATMSLTT